MNPHGCNDDAVGQVLIGNVGVRHGGGEVDDLFNVPILGGKVGSG